MFQKLANAVADQVIYKLAALNQALSEQGNYKYAQLNNIRRQKNAFLNAAIKLAALEKEAENLDAATMNDYLLQLQSEGIPTSVGTPGKKLITTFGKNKGVNTTEGILSGLDGLDVRAPYSAKNDNKAVIDAFRKTQTPKVPLQQRYEQVSDQLGALLGEDADLKNLVNQYKGEASRNFDDFVRVSGENADLTKKLTGLQDSYDNTLKAFGDASRESASRKVRGDQLRKQSKGLISKLRSSNNLNKVLGGSLAGLGLAGGAGLGALGIANARKAKQLAKLKQLGLLGGGAAALGGLGLGYLMGDN